MKNKAYARQTSRQAERQSRQQAEAGPNGISVAPPTSYGLDVITALQTLKTETGQTVQLKAEAKSPEEFAQIAGPVQMKSNDESAASSNKTGLPDTLKSGVEALSGLAIGFYGIPAVYLRGRSQFAWNIITNELYTELPTREGQLHGARAISIRGMGI